MSTRATAGAVVPVLLPRPEPGPVCKLPALLLARPLLLLPSPRRRRSARRACRLHSHHLVLSLSPGALFLQPPLFEHTHQPQRQDLFRGPLL